MIAKMSKTEISANFFYYRNHTKNYSAHVQGKVFPLKKQHKTNVGSGSSSRERHRILATILDLAEEAEKR